MYIYNIDFHDTHLVYKKLSTPPLLLSKILLTNDIRQSRRKNIADFKNRNIQVGLISQLLNQTKTID